MFAPTGCRWCFAASAGKISAMANFNSPPLDLARQMLNLLRVGTVNTVQPQEVRVLLTNDNGDDGGEQLVTDWLRWFNLRAGSVKTAFIPTPGEQCLVLSPGGNLAAGVVLLGLNSNEQPAPECGENDLVIDVPAGGKLLLRCGGSVIEITEGNIKATSGRIDLNEG